MTEFNKFSKEMDTAADGIDLKQAVGTKRKRAAKIRDKFVFGKMAWAESLTYISIFQSMIIFMALIPTAVGTMNSMFEWIGINYAFPVELASITAVVGIVVIFIFGLIAVRHIGTTKRAQEIGSKMNPGIYLLWKKMEEIEKKLEEKE